MRRPAILAVVTAVAVATGLGIDLTPAAAHICAQPVEIPVARPATVSVGVTVEDTTVPDLEITVPTGLQLDRVDPKEGWTFTRAGSTVRYHGGPIAAFTCAHFSFGVTAPTRGSFGIRVVQRDVDGKVVARSEPNPGNASDRILGQIVYAGVKPPPVATGSSGLPKVTIAGIALVGLGVVMVGMLGFRARRGRGFDAGEADDHEPGADRETELRERLERFKTRTPGRRPPR